MPRRRQTLRSSGQRKIISLQLLVNACVALIILAYLAAFFAFVPGDSVGRIRVKKPTVEDDHHKLLLEPPLKVADEQLQEHALHATGEAVQIGFAVTVTGCGSDPITEGAAVLKHSIHLSSVHGNRGGRYDYKMYAIYHPDGEQCALPLKDLGYTLVKRETPVAVKDIEGEFLRQNIEKNGCCGEKELVKLEGKIRYMFEELGKRIYLVLVPLSPAIDLLSLSDALPLIIIV